MYNNFNSFIERANLTHGDKFDDSVIMSADPRARLYFNGPRVLIETVYSSGTVFRRAGRVSVTTGWRPSLMLMHRSNAIGSGDLLGSNDKVIAVQSERGYLDVNTHKIVPAKLGYHETKAAA